MQGATLIDRFYLRRQEDEDDVFTFEQASRFLNEAQSSLTELDLLTKLWTLSFDPSSADIYSLPADFVRPQGQTVYVDDEEVPFMTESELSSDYPEWRGKEADDESQIVFSTTTTTGSPAISIYPVPVTTKTVKIQYYCSATPIASNRAAATLVMNGQNIPGVETYLLYKMLQFAAESEMEDGWSDRYALSAEKAMQSIMKSRNVGLNNDMSGWQYGAQANQTYADEY